MTKTFKHSGDLGDIIYSLPTIQKLGGGILYLDHTGGEGDQYQEEMGLNRKRGRKKLTMLDGEGCKFITPLLKVQNYIEDVLPWDGEDVDYNLNKHRELFKTHHPMNIAEQHLKAFGVSDYPYHKKTCFSKLKPWLNVPLDSGYLFSVFGTKPKPVIARSHRYHQAGWTWNELINENRLEIESGIFIGTEDEHFSFTKTFHFYPPHVKVKNALEMAQLITASSIFIGNQSFPFAIAAGAGATSYLEVFHFAANTLFNRGNIRIMTNVLTLEKYIKDLISE